MKTHFLLTGFSCTGKTSLGKQAFGEDVLDSDDEVLKWICKEQHQYFTHIYEIYMRDKDPQPATDLIQEAEEALIGSWAGDTSRKIISLGPGFPLRRNWKQLRDNSYVVLFRRSSAHGIYDSMTKRRENTFKACPKAKGYDNWDIDVMVDKDGKEFSKEVAVSKIQKLLDERESYYRDNDAEVVTDNALQKLMELKRAFWTGSSTEKRS
jgi:shikimate kinase